MPKIRVKGKFWAFFGQFLPGDRLTNHLFAKPEPISAVDLTTADHVDHDRYASGPRDRGIIGFARLVEELTWNMPDNTECLTNWLIQVLQVAATLLSQAQD
ncbi:MAG: hypothetical protein AAF773_22445 [Cyanobacteria bacterium P01_D01_bin.115]